MPTMPEPKIEFWKSTLKHLTTPYVLSQVSEHEWRMGSGYIAMRPNGAKKKGESEVNLGAENLTTFQIQ